MICYMVFKEIWAKSRCEKQKISYLFEHTDHSDHSNSSGSWHGWVLQGYSWSTARRSFGSQSSRSSQSLPFPWGTGWVQERYRFLTPPPQSTKTFSFPLRWQVVINLLQGLHPPSIASNEKLFADTSKMDWFEISRMERINISSNLIMPSE